MQTIVGFVIGYLVGAQEGKDGAKRLRSSFEAIKSSPEVRRLAGQAFSLAEQVTERTTARGLTTVGETVVRAITERVAGGRQEDSAAA